MSVHAEANRRPTEVIGIILTLALLAALLQTGSPGFTLNKDSIWTVAKYLPGGTKQKIERNQKRDRAKNAKQVEREQAIPVTADIPNLYAGLYQEYAGSDWRIVAGIYKIESDHGRSEAPGVHSGVNSFGCCAGPGQFNVRNGHPSTWEQWRPRRSANVYDPRDSVPATVRMLHHYYHAPITRHCPSDYGLNGHWVNAIRYYNDACWYVASVAEWAHTYSKGTAPPKGLSFTRSHGCDPAADWRKGLWTPEVRGFLMKMAARFRFRISCGALGHSQFVHGTHRQSAHWTGRAFDVDMVNGQYVSPSHPHDDFGQAALDYGARQVGGPDDLCPGRRCFTNSGHKEHWHVQP